MNIVGRKAEIDRFTTILENWDREGPLWIHFQGEPGLGKSHLIQYLLKSKLKDFNLIYHVNYQLYTFKPPAQIRDILHYIKRHFPKDVEVFLSKYPGYLRRAVKAFLDDEYDSDRFGNYSPNFFSELLFQMAQFLSTKNETLLVLENIYFEEKDHVDILFRFLNANSLPILAMTTGVDKAPEGLNANSVRMKKLSAVETQKLVQYHFSIREENARFIANHLQIKSQGNPRKIKFLLEAYYRDVIPSNSKEFLDPKKLQKLKISPIPDIIFRKLIDQLSEIEISVFSFLSHLADPLPLGILQRIMEKLETDTNLIQEWIRKGCIRLDEFTGESFVLIGWVEWKDFLRKNIDIRQAERVLEILNTDPILNNTRFPLQLSNLYFDIGELKTALDLAHGEARTLRKIGFEQRAYERYHFLKRNFTPYPDDIKHQGSILKEIGLLQRSLGLYENAFESFRELRDHVGKTDQERWFSASLQMAEILLKMDALTEARYLLNELKIKRVANAFTKAFSYMLLGDLEKNLGRTEYALGKYKQAFDLIDDIENAEFVYQLYSRIRAIYLENEEWEELESLILKSANAIPNESRFNLMIQFDLLRLQIEQKSFQSATELARSIYRQAKHNFDPGVMAQSILYLVDIYAFLSKWHLARSHLNQMMRIRLLVTHSKTAARMLINWAVVEKEIAHYGNAFRLLGRAEKICRKENFLHELNEIKIHKGHIQLLIHGYLRQREYLSDALRWAVANQDHELFIMATLYMTSYEIQQKRLKDAKGHLDEARRQIKLTGNEIDKLNYMYYLLRFLLATEKLRWGKKVLEVWKKKSNGITKFENLVLWFGAKLHYGQGDYKKALAEYELALEKSQKYKLPHLEFHILKEMVVLCHEADLKKEFYSFVRQIQNAYKNLLDAIDDEILQKQFYESREVHELVEIGVALD